MNTGKTSGTRDELKSRIYHLQGEIVTQIGVPNRLDVRVVMIAYWTWSGMPIHKGGKINAKNCMFYLKIIHLIWYLSKNLSTIILKGTFTDFLEKGWLNYVKCCEPIQYKLVTETTQSTIRILYNLVSNCTCEITGLESGLKILLLNCGIYFKTNNCLCNLIIRGYFNIHRALSSDDEIQIAKYWVSQKKIWYSRLLIY